MTARDGPMHTSVTTLGAYGRALWRKRLVVLVVVLVLPGATLFFSIRQPKSYQGTSEVLLTRQDLAAALTGTQQQGSQPNDPDRLVLTQAALADTRGVASRALAASGVSGVTTQQLLDNTEIAPRQGADLLQFKVTNPSPSVASRLASAYAQQFVAYRRELDTAALRSAEANVHSQVRALERRGDRRSPLYTSLVEKQQQLATLQTLETSNAYVVSFAAPARQVAPRPVRNTVLALCAALILGPLLALIADALDSRIRSAEELTDTLGLPLVGRLSAPTQAVKSDYQLVMLDAPGSLQAEQFRMLRSSLEFAMVGRQVRTLLVTSAVEKEGKSTTSANLAVAMASTRRRVILLDLDLRRPRLARFFTLTGAGVTELVLGHVGIDDVLHLITLPRENSMPATNGYGRQPLASPPGSLAVVPSGPLPPNAGEFVGTIELERAISDLAARCDLLIVDSPPLLRTGDALALSAHIDAILVVARLNLLRRGMVRDLRPVLDSIPAARLGLVLTAAQDEERRGYGYGRYYSDGATGGAVSAERPDKVAPV